MELEIHLYGLCIIYTWVGGTGVERGGKVENHMTALIS
jgi:hypothetical protein